MERCLQGDEVPKLRDVWEVTGRAPSMPLGIEVQCVWDKAIGFGVCPAVFLAFVQSSLPVCTFLLIGMGRGIQCHFMLERYNLLSDFARCGCQDIALSVSRDVRHLNSAGAFLDSSWGRWKCIYTQNFPFSFFPFFFCLSYNLDIHYHPDHCPYSRSLPSQTPSSQSPLFLLWVGLGPPVYPVGT